MLKENLSWLSFKLDLLYLLKRNNLVLSMLDVVKKSSLMSISLKCQKGRTYIVMR
ncbi:unnamed protein product [Meloidogyne enterolobii]|uniref:Uncharacterized protein n=1 Tax=Meloidogyne enterolobii TaxID=390850 RepID=A0ACB0ZUW7_MELEN